MNDMTPISQIEGILIRNPSDLLAVDRHPLIESEIEADFQLDMQLFYEGVELVNGEDFIVEPRCIYLTRSGALKIYLTVMEEDGMEIS